MGKKMAGTNEFAFFRCKSKCTGGGVQNQAEKKFEKMPSGRYRYKNLLFQIKKRTERKKTRSKTLRRGLRSACFPRKKRQENGTDTEKLRWWQNSTDLSAVLFLVRKGPLGWSEFPPARAETLG